jgi:hypothetical protein
VAVVARGFLVGDFGFAAAFAFAGDFAFARGLAFAGAFAFAADFAFAGDLPVRFLAVFALAARAALFAIVCSRSSADETPRRAHRRLPRSARAPRHAKISPTLPLGRPCGGSYSTFLAPRRYTLFQCGSRPTPPRRVRGAR